MPGGKMVLIGGTSTQINCVGSMHHCLKYHTLRRILTLLKHKMQISTLGILSVSISISDTITCFIPHKMIAVLYHIPHFPQLRPSITTPLSALFEGFCVRHCITRIVLSVTKSGEAKVVLWVVSSGFILPSTCS